VKPAAAADASTAASRVVPARNAAVKSTPVKPRSSESLKSEPCSKTESRTAAVKTRTSGSVASGSVAQPTAGRTAAVQRKSVVETSCQHEGISASVNKRKSLSVTASGTTGVKHEVPLSRSGRMAVGQVPRSVTNSTATSVTTKKPLLKQADSTPLTTGRTSVKHGKALSSAVKQSKDKQIKTDDDNTLSGSKKLHSVCASKVAELSSVSAVEVTDVIADNVAVSNSVGVSQDTLPPVNTSGSLHSDCAVNKSCEDVAEASVQISYIHSESPQCEAVRSCVPRCDLVLKSNSVIVPVTCVHENGLDLEENSVCDISLNSCRSDCSTSLFHSACSSIIGSIGDMKPPSLCGSLESDNFAMLSRSNSVSMESLRSSAGYCTPSEHDNFSEVADCTLSNTADSRFVYLS